MLRTTLGMAAVVGVLAFVAAARAASQDPPPAPPDLPEASSVTCETAWHCPLCRNGQPRNVLMEVCSDGSQKIIIARPCGEDCF